MTATKRSPDCNDCDCCIIYQSDFCEQLAASGSSLTYLGDEWDDDVTTGGESWQISTTDGGCVGLDCPDTDKPFASGLYHVSLPNRVAILEQRIPTAYHASVDFELFYDSSLPTSDYNIGLEVFWDFAGTNRYGSVRVSFDYETSTGSGGGYSLKIEVISAPTGAENVIGEFGVELPSTVENYRGTLKLGLVEAPTGCDDHVLCLTLTGDAASASRQFPVSLRFPDLDTTQFAIATAYSAFAGSTTFDCDGVITSIIRHVRVYEVFIERDESQRAECETCSWACCKCGIPLELDVTFSGWADSDCDVCDDDLNGTYSLGYIGQVSIDDELCCKWSYSWPAYSAPSCTVPSVISGAPYEDTMTLKKLDLTLCPGGVWQVNLHVIAGFSGGLIGGTCTYSWNYDEEIDSLSECSFEGTETFTYDSGLGCLAGSPGGTDIYAQFSHWCNTTGTVTVSNG